MGKSAGKVMPRPCGAYNASETYKILDMVTLDNKLWIAKKSGITGLEPSKTAPEWMMAVDGTTDVKELETEVDAKFASIDEQFLAKDTQISGLNTRVTDAEGSISTFEERITAAEGSISTFNDKISSYESAIGEMEEKFVFDTIPTKGSDKLVTSGTIYDMMHCTNVSNYTYGTISDNLSIRCDSYVDALMHSFAETKFNLPDNTFSHSRSSASIQATQGQVYINSSNEPMPDNTDETANKSSTEVHLDSKAIWFTMKMDDVSRKLIMEFDNLRPSPNGSYDLGTSSNKFKDIYATNDIIQTSDLTEKKDIADLNSELVSDLVMSLHPVSFKFIDGTSDRTHYGLIAQEVETLVNNLGISNKDFAPLIKSQKVETDENGNETPIEGEYVYGLRYAEFISILIKMCQNLQNEVDELKIRLGGE